MPRALNNEQLENNSCIYITTPQLSTITHRNMNIDQELSDVMSIQVVPDAELASYVQSLGELLNITVDLNGETSYEDDLVADESVDGEYLDDMIAEAAPAAVVEVETDIDSEFLETKLLGYELITNLTHLCVGDHLRITQNRYRESGRKCSYIVLKRYNSVAGSWVVNSFKSEFPDWQISVRPLNRYKNVRFYRKEPAVYTGVCHRCERVLKSPYRLCYSCTEKRRN
jgi:hypothetical protein